MSKVSIVRCNSYQQKEVDDTVRESLQLIGGIDEIIKPKKRVLLKVNMINSDFPEKAATTHPSILRAVIRMVKEMGGEPLVGDAPGVAYRRIECAWQKTGFRRAAEEEGAEVINFREVKEIDNLTNKRIPVLHIAKEVLDADVVISLPKLKTHSFTLFTGAIKNLYGTIPGFRKKELHALAPRPRDFAELMVDIFSVVKPSLAIMDGVVGMEGDGPICGSPYKVGLILAGKDLVALDAVASNIIGYHPFDIEITKTAAKRGLGVGKLEEIEIKGVPLNEAKVEDFELVSNLNTLLKRVPSFVFYVLRPTASLLLKVTPGVDEENCERCGDCAEACPVKAIKMENHGYPVISQKRCIRCFCCTEVCPSGSMKIERNWLARKLKM
ncbi:MAG: DUF362 domain-containing protein [Candidatus Aerophobetes bacterium]|nr:DUF362 domain-containing protein [Candidatus Aerophobetes bacterium]